MSKRIIKNVFAILSHDNIECLIDIIHNVERFDPKSNIIIYDSSEGRQLESAYKLLNKNIEFVENATPLKWGDLLEFPISCIEQLGYREYDTITFFDSDQLLINSGYTEFLSDNLPHSFGVLSSNPFFQGVDSNMMSVRDLHSEWALWEGYIKGFPRWEKAFVRSTFWPGTVLSADAAREIAREVRTPRVAKILNESKAWATEECILPTISYLLGFEEYQNPCNRDWCTFRTHWTVKNLEEARERRNAFYMHPVPRQINNTLRVAIRNISRNL